MKVNMTGKDIAETIIATGVIATYCALISMGRISAEALPPIVMYVVKKYLDGVAKEKEKNGNAENG